jgi:hypothetical protein
VVEGERERQGGRKRRLLRCKTPSRVHSMYHHGGRTWMLCLLNSSVEHPNQVVKWTAKCIDIGWAAFRAAPAPRAASAFWLATIAEDRTKRNIEISGRC